MGIKEKIAFLILAHSDPQHLKKLISALDYPMFDIYVHVDAKADIEHFEFNKYKLKYSRLFILDNREKIYWADYSIVSATLNMYRCAFAKDKYVRYVTLSGNDYPLQSNDTIYSILSEPKVEYIMGSPTEKPEKVKYYYFNRWGLFGRVLTHLFRWGNIIRNNGKLEINGMQYDIYFAPQWHALSSDCVKYILDVFEANERTIYCFFRYSFAPDELLIPTLVFNSVEFKNNSMRSKFPKGTHYNQMTAIHYIDYEPVVRVFSESDMKELISSGKLFARKLKSGISDSLIEQINKERI